MCPVQHVACRSCALRVMITDQLATVLIVIVTAVLAPRDSADDAGE